MATVFTFYAPVPEKKTSFSLTRSDSNAGDVETYNTPTKDIVNHVAWLQDQVSPATAAAAVRVNATVAALMTNFVFNVTPPIFGQSSVASEGTLILPITLTQSSTARLFVTEIGCRIKPIGGHVGLPATLPSLRLRTKSSATLATAAFTWTTATDAPLSVGAYEAEHNLSLTGLSLNCGILDSLYGVFLDFRGEAGANSIAGLTVGNFYIKYYFGV